MTEQTTPNRIFKIGSTTIVEDESLAGKSLEEVKIILQRTYPEVAHATMREVTLEDGSICHHFIARAGRKG